MTNYRSEDSHRIASVSGTEIHTSGHHHTNDFQEVLQSFAPYSKLYKERDWSTLYEDAQLDTEQYYDAEGSANGMYHTIYGNSWSERKNLLGSLAGRPHRHSDSLRLPVRRSEPSGCRHAGELRHSLEPGAPDSAFRTYRPYRLAQQVVTLCQFLAGLIL